MTRSTSGMRTIITPVLNRFNADTGTVIEPNRRSIWHPYDKHDALVPYPPIGWINDGIV
jgi:hypothetical protein